MTPTHTRRGEKLYLYYVSQSVLKRGADACPVGRVPAAETEVASSAHEGSSSAHGDRHDSGLMGCPRLRSGRP